MNRIYQGKLTNVEIANRPILSASIPFSASDGEKVAKPDEVSPESGERTEVRCRNQNPRLPFADDPKQAKAIGHRLSVIGNSPEAHAHQLVQDVTNFSSPVTSAKNPSNSSSARPTTSKSPPTPTSSSKATLTRPSRCATKARSATTPATTPCPSRIPSSTAAVHFFGETRPSRRAVETAAATQLT